MKFVFSVMFLCFLGILSVSAAENSFSITKDKNTETYTILDGDLPALSYHFGVVPYPKDQKVHYFSKKATPYDGAYYSDGSAFGADRSDYIQPVYGFNGEPLTDDYPKDHPHHRGLWWSWCEVRWNDKIGDIWAVNKIRAYPKGTVKTTIGKDFAELEAVNVWKFDGDPTEIVKEISRIRVSKTTGIEGKKSRNIDLSLELEALVDGVAIAGRQKVNYGGYGGIALRMVPEAEDFSIRTVHPAPDQWRGSDDKMAEIITDPQKFGKAAWLSIFGKYPTLEKKAAADFTTITMFESEKNPLFPNPFRYYSSRNIMIAFPAFHVFSLGKNAPVSYKCRFRIQQGKSDPISEWNSWKEYQNLNAE
ncbi:MAG: PmoA family protein [Planctomycetia bacterium]|nr:PmoA family protein [Planctomycetia bacterium]